MTAFLSIQSALKAALAATPALAGGRITPNRVRAIPAAHATAIAIRLDQSSADENVIGMLDWQTVYAVECYARATSGTDPAAAIDTLLSDVWTRLASLTHATLGADISLQPQIDWQYDDADTPTVCAVIRLTARHRTTCTNLSAT